MSSRIRIASLLALILVAVTLGGCHPSPETERGIGTIVDDFLHSPAGRGIHISAPVIDAAERGVALSKRFEDEIIRYAETIRADARAVACSAVLTHIQTGSWPSPFELAREAPMTIALETAFGSAVAAATEILKNVESTDFSSAPLDPAEVNFYVHSCFARESGG